MARYLYKFAIHFMRGVEVPVLLQLSTSDEYCNTRAAVDPDSMKT